jgi:hypothetical protein
MNRNNDKKRMEKREIDFEKYLTIRNKKKIKPVMWKELDSKTKNISRYTCLVFFKTCIPIAIDIHCLIRFIEGKKNIEKSIKKLEVLFLLSVKIK